MTGLEILPVFGIPDVRPGDDLARLIAAAAPWLRDGDVLVVTSKIVSKAEGRLVEVPEGGPEREAAREAALRAETSREVARRGHTRIVQTHHGFVMASAGIDASNVHRSRLVLLPADPDGSARRLRAELRDRHGLDIAVIVSDTMGRPWRNGLTDVALGAAGLSAVRDYRGETDPYGNELHITLMAVADELSAAAELVKGKCDQVPVAVVRGLALTGRPDGPGAAVLVRGPDTDMFALGTAEALAAGHRAAATLSADVGPWDAGTAAEPGPALAGAVERVAAWRPGAATLAILDDLLAAKVAGMVGASTPATVAVIGFAASAPPAELVSGGGWLHRLRAALAASGRPHVAAEAAGALAELVVVDPDAVATTVIAVW